MIRLVCLLLSLSMVVSACGSNTSSGTSTVFPNNSIASLSKQLTDHSAAVKAATATPTYDQQMVVIKLFQAMFNATPGADLLSLCSGLLAVGISESALANLLADTALFQSSSFYPQSLSNLDFSLKFIHNLVGSTVSETNTSALASQLAALLDGGWKRGDAMWLLVAALTNVSTSNPDWGTAAAQLNNRLRVSYYYSAIKAAASSDMVTMQAVTASVTANPATAAAVFSGEPNPQVTITTGKGTVVVELYPGKAPITVINFLSYVHEGFYSNTLFHRVVPGFVVQGGGYSTSGYLKATHLSIPLEPPSSTGLTNAIGTIAMARTSELNSATSQFFFNTVDNNSSAGNNLDMPAGQGYAVFGSVISGMDVVKLIEAAPIVDPTLVSSYVTIVSMNQTR